MSLLTTPIVKISHSLAGDYFIFPEKRPRKNLKDFQYQSWTSEMIGKVLNKFIFRHFLQFSCSKVRSKLF